MQPKTWIFLVGMMLIGPSGYACPIGTERVLYLNTSNTNKLKEFQEYLPGCKIERRELDLDEPLSDDITVVQYKASQFEDGFLVDDVSLEIENAEVGINIRWLIPVLGNYAGRSARFTCLLAVRDNDVIRIYRGTTHGTLVKPRGDGFGIGPYFLPEGASKTLGELMDPKFNPRYLAIQNFIRDQVDAVRPLLKTWTGKFQN